jgi:hypothetical protein
MRMGTICQMLVCYNFQTEMTMRYDVPNPGRPITEVIARLPRGFREDAEKGFIVLASVPEAYFDQIVETAISVMETQRPPLETLHKDLNLSKSDTSSLFSAAMVVVPLFDKSTSVNEFIDGAVKAKLIDAAITPKLRPFVEVVASHASDIATAIKRATLTDQCLPSFYDMDVTVDLRVGFEEGRVDVVVPVALIHFDTDAEKQELWFQASKPQLMLIRDNIDAAIKKMDAAEAWGAKS